MGAKLFTVALLGALAVLTFALGFVPGDAEARGCIRLMRQSGQEILVNACNTCKVVLVTRERRGASGPPDLRSYTVLERGRHTLPFKGPGRTRIGVEEPCASPSRQSVDPNEQLTDASETLQCIRALNVKGRGVMLANRCGECRAVVVERTRSGRPPRREAVALPGKSMAPLRGGGYTGGRLIKEGACR